MTEYLFHQFFYMDYNTDMSATKYTVILPFYMSILLRFPRCSLRQANISFKKCSLQLAFTYGNIRLYTSSQEFLTRKIDSWKRTIMCLSPP